MKKERNAMDDRAITGALGLESAYGFHVEGEPALPDIPMRDRHAAAWYPCLALDHTYTGCLGEACPLEECWTGSVSVSYQAAIRRRYHLTDGEYAAGARCLQCCHVEETAIPVMQRCRLIHIIALHCREQRWRHPVSAAAFVRRRIPACDGGDLARCPAFEQASRPIPAVERQRARLNESVRARRAAQQARHHG